MNLTLGSKLGDNEENLRVTNLGVRGQGSLNAKRQALVDKAFLKFDKDGNGCIEAADLRGVYNCSFHPKVQSGEMTEDQVFLEFLQSFGDRNHDAKTRRFFPPVSKFLTCFFPR